MLDVTSRLRKAQEEDAELSTKAGQQRAALHQAETRAEDARRRLGILRQGTASATTAGAVLGQLQREVRVGLLAFHPLEKGTRFGGPGVENDGQKSSGAQHHPVGNRVCVDCWYNAYVPGTSVEKFEGA